jgi:hypothetical protein
MLVDKKAQKENVSFHFLPIFFFGGASHAVGYWWIQ